MLLGSDYSCYTSVANRLYVAKHKSITSDKYNLHGGGERGARGADFQIGRAEIT